MSQIDNNNDVNKFSYFSSVKSTTPKNVINANIIYNSVLLGLYKAQIDKIRGEKDKNNQKALKQELPAVTFSGVFSYRNAEGLVKHSGLICLDFDHIDSLLDKKEQIRSDKYTHLSFISPSGDGLKVVVKIEGDKHEESFLQSSQYYKEKYNIEADKSGKDVSRLCFMSYDTTCIYNENSEVFIVKLKGEFSEAEDIQTVEEHGITYTTTPNADYSNDNTETSIIEVERALDFIGKAIRDNRLSVNYNDALTIFLGIATELGLDECVRLYEMYYNGADKAKNITDIETKFRNNKEVCSLGSLFHFAKLAGFKYSNEVNNQVIENEPTNTQHKEDRLDSIDQIVKDFENNPRLNNSAIPPHLSDKLEYLQTLTSAPREFLFLSLVTSLAGLMGNVSIQSGGLKIKPTLYSLILAGSSTFKKSTATDCVIRNIEALEEKKGISLMFGNSGSQEGLIEVMRDNFENEIERVPQRSGVASVGEFAAWIGGMNKEYNKGYKDMLLDMYDGRKHKRNLKKVEYVVSNPAMSILSSSTMSQFLNCMKEADKESGFMQRFIFSYLPASVNIEVLPLSRLKERDNSKDNELVDWFDVIYSNGNVIAESNITVKLSNDAVGIYEDSYYKDIEFIKQLEKSDSDKAALLGGYFGRCDTMKYKLSMIFELSRLGEIHINNKSDLEVQNIINSRIIDISAESMKCAVEYVEYFKQNVIYLLFKEVKFGWNEKKEDRILNIIRKGDRKGISRADLLKKSKDTAKGLALHLETLLQQDVIGMRKEKAGNNKEQIFYFSNN